MGDHVEGYGPRPVHFLITGHRPWPPPAQVAAAPMRMTESLNGTGAEAPPTLRLSGTSADQVFFSSSWSIAGGADPGAETSSSTAGWLDPAASALRSCSGLVGRFARAVSLAAGSRRA